MATNFLGRMGTGDPECPSRAHLQRFLAAWHAVLHATRQSPQGKGVIRWAVDVDPLAI